MKMLGELDIGDTGRAVHGRRRDMRRSGERSLPRRPHLDLEQVVQQPGGQVAHQGHSQAHSQPSAKHYSRVQEPQRFAQGQLKLPKYILLRQIIIRI